MFDNLMSGSMGQPGPVQDWPGMFAQHMGGVADYWRNAHPRDIAMGFVGSTGPAKGIKAALQGTLPLKGGTMKSGKFAPPEIKEAHAKAAGFDPQVWYHGTPFDISEFRAGRRPTYLADDPNIASAYSSGERFALADRVNATPNVMPLRSNVKNPMIVDMEGKSALYLNDIVGSSDAHRLAKARGHDGILMKNMQDIYSDVPQNQLVVFDPKNIRSVNAAFDPTKRNSPDLLAAGMAVPAGMFQQDQQGMFR